MVFLLTAVQNTITFTYCRLKRSVKFEFVNQMIIPSTRVFKKLFRKIRTGRIMTKIRSGKIVYLENPCQEIVLKYVPREYGRYGKYYVKQYGLDKYGKDFDSVSILMAVMDGKRINKARYDSYHSAENVIWNRKINTPSMERAVKDTWVYV